MKKSGIMLFLCVLTGYCSIDSKAQDSGVRISWDGNSYRKLRDFKIKSPVSTAYTAYYPRIKRLGDGSLMLVFMNAQTGYNIYVRKSYDDAQTWGDAALVRKQTSNEVSPTTRSDKKVFACPDFIELDNGVILLAYQWRYNNAYASPAYTNVSCGIELMRSSDYGETWEEPKQIYTGRMWEPSFIKLPSGEIQMLFTDSHDVSVSSSSTAISRPCVSLLRSMDNGETWQEKEMCSYEDAEVLSRIVDAEGTYDGMPVGKCLSENRGIVYACESYGYAQTPWIVYSASEKNWNYDDFDFASGGPESRRWLLHEDFVGYAPYLEVLPSGNVIVQSNGKYKGVNSLWTFIGDENARNFSYASTPYSGWWGSIAYIGNDEVISTANAEYKKGSITYMGLRMMKGKLNYARTVYKSPLTLQPLSSFDRSLHNDWFIGEKSASYAYVNFGYTDSHFEYTVHLFDSLLTAFTPVNADVVVIRMNRTNTGSGESVSYQMAVNAKGDFSLDKKPKYTWTSQDVSSVNDITVNLEGTLNDNSDVDRGYAVKVSVPWELLGGLPASGDTFRVHLIQRYKDTVTESPVAVAASLAGEDPDDSSIWLKINFSADSGAGVSEIRRNDEEEVYITGRTLYVTRPEKIASIVLYNLFGQVVCNLSSVRAQYTVDLSQGIYLLKYRDMAGEWHSRRTVVRGK